MHFSKCDFSTDREHFHVVGRQAGSEIEALIRVGQSRRDDKRQHGWPRRGPTHNDPTEHGPREVNAQKCEQKCEQKIEQNIEQKLEQKLASSGRRNKGSRAGTGGPDVSIPTVRADRRRELLHKSVETVAQTFAQIVPIFCTQFCSTWSLFMHVTCETTSKISIDDQRRSRAKFPSENPKTKALDWDLGRKSRSFRFTRIVDWVPNRRPKLVRGACPVHRAGGVFLRIERTTKKIQKEV